MEPPSTIFVKWQSDIDLTTEPEDDIAFVFTQPTKGASRYTISLPQAESSNEMKVAKSVILQKQRAIRAIVWQVLDKPINPEFSGRIIAECTNEKDANRIAEAFDEIAALRSALADNEQLRESMASQIETQQVRIAEKQSLLDEYFDGFKGANERLEYILQKAKETGLIDVSTIQRIMAEDIEYIRARLIKVTK